MSKDRDKSKGAGENQHSGTEPKTGLSTNSAIEAYSRGLDALYIEFKNQDRERLKEFVRVAAEALRCFLNKETYGDPEQCTPENKPKYWTYTRFLVWDILRPQLGHGDTEYASHNFSDKFLQDITDTAHEIAQMLPDNINIEEWYFLVRVWSHMMMKNPFLVDEGFITEAGRDNLLSQTRSIGPSDTHYHVHFKAWVKENSSGMRNEYSQTITPNHQ